MKESNIKEGDLYEVTGSKGGCATMKCKDCLNGPLQILNSKEAFNERDNRTVPVAILNTCTNSNFNWCIVNPDDLSPLYLNKIEWGDLI